MFSKAASAAGLLLFSFTTQATLVRTIDLVPIDGTTLNSLTAPGGTVFDFGTYGKGHVAFTSLSNGASFASLFPIQRNAAAVTLDNGNQFVSNNLIGFDLVGNGASFVITVTLDAGVLPAGSVFEMLSLDRSGASAQYFLPGIGIGAVDSHQLLSDGAIPLVADQSGVFSAASNGISAGRAWDVGGVNSFSGTFSQDRRFGGVGFTIAVAQIPEPGSLALVFVSLGALAAVHKRRRSRSTSSIPRGCGCNAAVARC
jgi:hypothetical protein